LSTKTTQKMIAFTANLVKQLYTTKYSKVSYRFLLTKLKKNFLNHIYKLDMKCFTIYCIRKKNSKAWYQSKTSFLSTCINTEAQILGHLKKSKWKKTSDWQKSLHYLCFCHQMVTLLCSKVWIILSLTQVSTKVRGIINHWVDIGWVNIADQLSWYNCK